MGHPLAVEGYHPFEQPLKHSNEIAALKHSKSYMKRAFPEDVTHKQSLSRRILMMISLAGLVITSLLAVGARSAHFNIPQVNAAVHHALDEFSAYVNYLGPPKNATSNLTYHGMSTQAAIADPSYWFANQPHQGRSAFNSNSRYQVWRNVKDFGAKGDGVTDDTAAINAAISSGNRCAPGSCQSSTITPAVVYFPAGTYMVSQPIIDYYYTQITGNPNGRAVIKATSGFSGFAVIDADPYQSNGNQAYGSTNVFWRQIKNIVIDLTAIPASSAATALHWPTAQATSLQNIQINLSQASGTQHVGIFIENGSAGWISDIVIYGGKIGFNIGNQQFTIRNIQINNAATAINQLWNWGFTYKSLQVSNCSIGIDMSATDTSGTSQQVGSMMILDSSFSGTGVAIKTSHDTAPKPPSAGSLVLENVAVSNVGTTVQGGKGATILAGGSQTINAWAQGHAYRPTGPSSIMGSYTPNARGNLAVNGKYVEIVKPNYAGYTTSQVLSARSLGAKGDGATDDTTAVQNLLTQAAASSKIAFFDAGTYKVTGTIYIPPNSRVVGESFSVIMSAGSTFTNINSPVAVVQVGKSGDSGLIQWQDMIVSTQGSQPGAKLIEWNIAATSGSGMWDVHTRVGGFAGSNLQLAQCPTSASPNVNCYAAYMSMHVTKGASNVYLENVWLWTADHDVEDASNTQISIYTGRGLLYEATAGPGWLWGTGVEHHHLYQYQFANTKNVVMGFIQTETPYYQPSPDAKNSPYPISSTINDPDYNTICTQGGNCDALGLRILNSQGIYIYGAGLYSFFNRYSTTCSNAGGPENCQSQIMDIENSSGIYMYDLSTVGTTCMLYRDGKCLANYADNVNVFPDTIALFQSG